MTREEAIHELQEDKRLYETEVCHAGDGSPDGRLLEALDMAIEALECERIKCSHCKHYIRHDHRCGWWNHGVSNVDWCSYGERREE